MLANYFQATFGLMQNPDKRPRLALTHRKVEWVDTSLQNFCDIVLSKVWSTCQTVRLGERSFQPEKVVQMLPSMKYQIPRTLK